MIKQKQIARPFNTRAFIISGLMLGLWIGGCTRALYVNGKEAKFDGGNIGDLAEGTIDVEEAKDVKRQETSAAVDAAKNDLRIKDGGGVVPGTNVTISAGGFMMGSATSEACRVLTETQHQVTLTHSFQMQQTEVTQGQFQNLMGYNPSYHTSCGSNCPVEQVSWHEAAAYCNALSTQGGYAKCYDCGGSGSSVTCSQNASYTGSNIYNCLGYRLPTEAEWEYAYRAGTTTSLYNNTNVVNCSSSDANTNVVGWNKYNSSSTTHAAGGKPANNWGLYDMAGNVYEWCNDWWDGTTPYGTAAVTNPWGLASGSSRVVRGGSRTNDPNNLRAAYRTYYAPSFVSGTFGFRCLRAN